MKLIDRQKEIPQGYIHHRLDWPFHLTPITTMYTASSRPDEYYRILESQIYTIDDEGLRGRFSALIGQSKAFWKAAVIQDTSSSALSYYHSFLNLAKAYLTLKTRIVDQRTMHGISDPGLSSEAIDMAGDEVSIHFSEKAGMPVFPKLLNMIQPSQQASVATEQTIRVSAKSLLTCVSDISYQGMRLLGPIQFIPSVYPGHNVFHYRKDIASQKDCAVIVIAIHANAKGCENDGLKARRVTEVLDPFERQSLFEWFGLNAWELSDWEIFISEQIFEPTHMKIASEFYRLLGHHFQPNVFSDGVDFEYLTPIIMTKKDGIDFKYCLPEPLAIYLLMFYLGSSIRYRPERFGGKDPCLFLFEHFTETAPIYFLAYMTNWIIGQGFVLKQR